MIKKNLHKTKHNSKAELWCWYLLAAFSKPHTPRRKCIWTLHRYSQHGERLGRISCLSHLSNAPLHAPTATCTSAAVRESSPSLCLVIRGSASRQELLPSPVFLRQHLLSKHKYVYCGNFVLALLPSLFARCFSFYTHRRHRAVF